MHVQERMSMSIAMLTSVQSQRRRSSMQAGVVRIVYAHTWYRAEVECSATLHKCMCSRMVNDSNVVSTLRWQ